MTTTTPYAQVAVNTAVDAVFDYHIPPQLIDQVSIGALVRVAFGTAQQPAIIVNLMDSTPITQTKPILELIDPAPVVTPTQINLARWLAAYYLCPLGLALWLFLPPGISGRRDVRVRLLPSATPDDALSAEAQQLFDLLQRRGTLTGEQINRAMKHTHWHKALDALKRRGLAQSESMLHAPRAKPRKIQVAALNVPAQHLPYVRDKLGKSTRLTDALQQAIALCRDADAPVSLSQILKIPGVGEATLTQMLDSGLIICTAKGEAVIAAPDAEDLLFHLRGGETDAAILRVLAREDKPVDVSWLYAQSGAELADLKRLAAHSLIQLGEREAIRDPLRGVEFVPVSAPRLTAGQRAVWATLQAAVQKAVSNTGAPPSGGLKQSQGRVFLLHGVTGAGKTEIYLRAMEQTVAEGRQAILLVPEIALTPQTIRRVLARFPVEQVAIAHSHLTEGERYDTWRRARDGQISVVVGTRSALFTPLPDVGLIILDEEHDASYKQAPPFAAPHYHTREVAEQMANAHHAVLILGSATPDIGTYERAQHGNIGYLHLPQRIMGHRVHLTEQATQVGRTAPRHTSDTDNDSALMIDLPPVQIVDMRDELKAGNMSIFSRVLEDSLKDVIERGEQAILFLNRRGTATHIFCRDCGAVFQCPRCDTPMTYHHDSNNLQCHHCGHKTAQPDSCPSCGSKRIRYFGAGTQHIEEAFKVAFPQAIALRWDADSARADGHDLILTRFLNREAQVLIGTQMIAKGLDLPLVTLVGVVSADVGLNLPDFRAGERTFQVLAQVAGRAGRGILGGRVILQTYQPEHPAIVAASQHDYSAFAERELSARRDLGYPPFRRLTRVIFTDANPAKAQANAKQAAHTLTERLNELEITSVEVIGPVPCFYTRLDRLYRWQVILRGDNPSKALAGWAIPPGASIDVDPVDVL